MSKTYKLYDNNGNLVMAWDEEFHKVLMTHPVIKDKASKAAKATKGRADT